jgi:hypothetical protein
MNESADQVGDLLRAFYAMYGVRNEGPPSGVNVTEMIGGAAVSVQDAQLLKDALDNASVRRQFIVCREIVEDLAARLSGDELLRELSGLDRPSDREFEQLSSGVFWFSLAASLDQRKNGLPKTPFDAQIDLPLQVRVRLTVEGSLVMRLYIALVYMREGALGNLIAKGCLARGPCCGRVNKLLNSDYVRRVRNALSHGTFSATIAGIAFQDDDGVIVATPGFLDWLCTWLMLIQLQAVAATRPDDPT